jgi:hypothetical protein
MPVCMSVSRETLRGRMLPGSFLRLIYPDVGDCVSFLPSLGLLGSRRGHRLAPHPFALPILSGAVALPAARAEFRSASG